MRRRSPFRQKGSNDLIFSKSRTRVILNVVIKPISVRVTSLYLMFMFSFMHMFLVMWTWCREMRSLSQTGGDIEEVNCVCDTTPTAAYHMTSSNCSGSGIFLHTDIWRLSDLPRPPVLGNVTPEVDIKWLRTRYTCKLFYKYRSINILSGDKMVAFELLFIQSIWKQILVQHARAALTVPLRCSLLTISKLTCRIWNAMKICIYYKKTLWDSL